MKIKINVPTNLLVDPIIAESIIETKTLLNISQAHIDSTQGSIVADVTKEEFNRFKKSLASKGAGIIMLDTPIMRDEDECVECGACVSVCPVKVFSFDAEWSLKVDQDKCIQCGTCVEMCPHNALALEK